MVCHFTQISPLQCGHNADYVFIAAIWRYCESMHLCSGLKATEPAVSCLSKCNISDSPPFVSSILSLFCSSANSGTCIKDGFFVFAVSQVSCLGALWRQRFPFLFLFGGIIWRFYPPMAGSSPSVQQFSLQHLLGWKLYCDGQLCFFRRRI